MMTPATLWMFGLGPKPEQGLMVAPMPVFEKVYPVHRYSHEIDPRDHQCECCGTVTDLICERCEAVTCDNCFGMEKFGGPYGDGPMGLNYCKSCMESYYDRDDY